MKKLLYLIPTACCLTFMQCSIDEIPAPDSPDKSTIEEASERKPVLIRNTHDGRPNQTMNVSTFSYPVLFHETSNAEALTFRVESEFSNSRESDVYITISPVSLQQPETNRLYNAYSASYSFSTEQHEFESLYENDIHSVTIHFEEISQALVKGNYVIEGNASFGPIRHSVFFELVPYEFSGPLLDL